MREREITDKFLLSKKFKFIKHEALNRWHSLPCIDTFDDYDYQTWLRLFPMDAGFSYEIHEDKYSKEGELIQNTAISPSVYLDTQSDVLNLCRLLGIPTQE